MIDPLCTNLIYQINNSCAMDTDSKNSNDNYQIIGTTFYNNYCYLFNLDILSVESLYQKDAKCSLNIYLPNENILYEAIGYFGLRDIFARLHINNINLYKVVPSCQPVGKNSIIILFSSSIEINKVIYNCSSSIILRVFPCGTTRISNHILSVYFNLN